MTHVNSRLLGCFQRETRKEESRKRKKGKEKKGKAKERKDGRLGVSVGEASDS